MSGGEEEELCSDMDEDGKSFFFQKCYHTETARFEDVSKDVLELELEGYCVACRNKELKEKVSFILIL